MDRQAQRNQADTHKKNAVIAREEGRRWDALFEECMYFYFDCQLKGTTQKELPTKAMLTFGLSFVLLGLSPQARKELTASIVQWAQESGQEDELETILERFKS